MVTCASAPRAQVLRSDLWTTNGTVDAITVGDSLLYIGGDFDRVGPIMGGGVTVDTRTGVALEPYPLVQGVVRAALPDGRGGWYVGGWFSHVAGKDVGNLAHLDASGAIVEDCPVVDGSVEALSLSNDRLYLGGHFDAVGGYSRNRLAAIDTRDGSVLAWDPDIGGSLAYVASICSRGSVVYVAGFFGLVGGVERTGVAAIDSSEGFPLDWNPRVNSSVFAVEERHGVVFLGGSFSVVGDSLRRYIAGVDSVTGAPLTWNPDADNIVDCIVACDQAIYCGGGFRRCGGQAREGVVALDVVTGRAQPWNAGIEAPTSVFALAVTNDCVYIGGVFERVAGVSVRYAIACRREDGALTNWRPDPANVVNAIGVSNGEAFIGGAFSFVGGVSREHIAALATDTGQASAWNPGADGRVYALAYEQGALYAGGTFSVLGGVPRRFVGAVDVAGQVADWDPNPNGRVDRLAIQKGTVYLAGGFTSVRDHTRRGAAAIRQDGTLTPWAPVPDGPIKAMCADGARMYVGGWFTNVDGQPRNGLAAVDTLNGALAEWDPAQGAPGAQVYGLAVHDTAVYVSGAFAHMGGAERHNLAALRTCDGSATTWAPPVDYVVRAFAFHDTTVFAGGTFLAIGGRQQPFLAALGAGAGTLVDWRPDVCCDVGSLVTDGDALYAGGSFTYMNGLPIHSLAKFALPPSARTPARLRLWSTPNPSFAALSVSMEAPGETQAEACVYDVAGRLVRRLYTGPLPVGVHNVRWDLTRKDGRRVEAGLYFIRLTSKIGDAVARIAIVR